MSLGLTLEGLYASFKKELGEALYQNERLFTQYLRAKELGDLASMAIVQDRAKVLWEPFRAFSGPCGRCGMTKIIRFAEPQDFCCPVCPDEAR